MIELQHKIYVRYVHNELSIKYICVTIHIFMLVQPQ